MDKKIIAVISAVLFFVFMTGAKAYALGPEQKQELMEYFRSYYKNVYGESISDKGLDDKVQQSINEIETAIANGTYTSTTTSTETHVDYNYDKDKYITYVNSVDEFFEEVCYQLKDHRTVEYYDTDVELLYNNADYIFDGIENYYYKTNPMISSDYLIRFCDNSSTNCSWEERNIPGEKKYRIGITFKYAYTQEEIEEHSNKMIELSQSLKRENDLESIKAVHDYLTDEFEWKDNVEDSIAGFKYSGATCSGYSMAAFELLYNMGINARIVEGNVTVDGQEYYNTWNIVELDGKWYNIDVSWDDNGEYGTRYDWFLKSNAEFERHSYREERSDIRNMISKESYFVPEELLNSNIQVPENSTTEQVDYKDDKHNNITPGQLVRRFWYLAIYPIFGIAALIRRLIIRTKKDNDNIYKHYKDDLSAEIAAYYKSKDRSYYN